MPLRRTPPPRPLRAPAPAPPPAGASWPIVSAVMPGLRTMVRRLYGVPTPHLARMRLMAAAPHKAAILYRMATPEHTCPYGIKAKDLLRRSGFAVDDRLLAPRVPVGRGPTHAHHATA